MQEYRYKFVPQVSQRAVGRYARPNAQDRELPGDSVMNLPAHGSYGNLLFDPRWKAKRTEIMTRDNGCCVICKETEELQVHHRQYQFVKAAKAFKMPWDYPNDLLITLCRSCHQRGHSKYKVPTIVI